MKEELLEIKEIISENKIDYLIQDPIYRKIEKVIHEEVLIVQNNFSLNCSYGKSEIEIDKSMIDLLVKLNKNFAETYICFASQFIPKFYTDRWKISNDIKKNIFTIYLKNDLLYRIEDREELINDLQSILI